jgi:hypothetical protein
MERKNLARIPDCVQSLSEAARVSRSQLQDASGDLSSINGQSSNSRQAIAESRELLDQVNLDRYRARPNGNIR